MNSFNIYILDDNEFFLRLFHNRIERHSRSLEISMDTFIGIRSFSDYESFLSHFDTSVDMVFLDFNLGNGINACGVMKTMQKKGNMPRTVIVSEMNAVGKLPLDLAQHVEAFIRKDTYVLPRSCLLIQDLLENKIQKNA